MFMAGTYVYVAVRGEDMQIRGCTWLGNACRGCARPEHACAWLCVAGTRVRAGVRSLGSLRANPSPSSSSDMGGGLSGFPPPPKR